MIIILVFKYSSMQVASGLRNTHDDQTYLKMPETFSPFGTLCQMELDRFTFLQQKMDPLFLCPLILGLSLSRAHKTYSRSFVLLSE